VGATAVRAGGRGLVDATGRAVRLGKELGRGGEGSVFDVDGESDVVAKLYHAPPEPEKAAKLAAMARSASPALTSVAAWPTNTLHEGGGAPVAGLLMPRASGAEVHRLYSPAYRKVEFPNYDWEKLIVVARNVAAAVARIHDAGHVIGDVNQGNVLVSPTGVVRLIDCDSFQIRDGATWRLCEVGVAHFTPPELQGRSFRGVVRTQNHDAFGLAVLVFHLLFMGRHPFAGRYGGKGDMPLEQAASPSAGTPARCGWRPRRTRCRS
jgi:DNA-binding helix-hairpin-helix protein with protein kinase domain